MPLQANIGPVGELAPTKLLIGANVLRAVDSDKRDKGVFVHQIRVTNTDTVSRTVTLDKFDGATAFPFAWLVPVALGVPYTDQFEFSLGPGWSLRATPEVADKLFVHVTLSSRP